MQVKVNWPTRDTKRDDLVSAVCRSISIPDCIKRNILNMRTHDCLII